MASKPGRALYRPWAAQTRNLVAERAASGETLQKILDFVARARAQLADRMDDHPRYPYSLKRPDYADPRIRAFSTLGHESRDMGPFARRMVRLARSVMRHRPVISRSDGRLTYAPNLYQGRSGRRLSATMLHRKDGYIQVLHPVMRRSTELHNDALARLSTLLSARRRAALTTGRLEEYCAALFACHNAVYWCRGSAAIVDTFFGGLYPVLFGRKLPLLPDGIDVSAMILDQDEFSVRILDSLDR